MLGETISLRETKSENLPGCADLMRSVAGIIDIKIKGGCHINNISVGILLVTTSRAPLPAPLQKANKSSNVLNRCMLAALPAALLTMLF
jgi:hypothetical protein